MKKSILFLCLIILALPLLGQQTPIYLNFTTHVEDTDPIKYVSDSVGYLNHRQLVKQLADIVIAQNVKWNCELEWNYLLGVLRFDKSAQSNTGGKNIVKWMKENSGGLIDIDPHSHQNSGYNYADVAHLIDSCGITSSKVAGGFPYNDATAGISWMEFENGMAGRKYKFIQPWKADIIWGPAKKGEFHGGDINALGAWKPKSSTEFMVNNAANRVTLIGNGPQNIVAETTDVAENIAVLQEYVDAIASGKLPAGKFYSATLMFVFRDFTPGLLDRFRSVLDSVQKFIDAKTIRWASITEKDSIWKATYNSEPNYLIDDDITSIEKSEEVDLPVQFSLSQNYPNPFNPVTTINFSIPEEAKVTLSVYNQLGERIAILVNKTLEAGSHSATWNAVKFPSGIYFYEIRTANFSGVKKLLLLK
jgi:hypothetical protein